ncbi:MAG: hypothetical protein ACRD6W_09375, partial [Nitrososphaerales archaeon]
PEGLGYGDKEISSRAAELQEILRRVFGRKVEVFEQVCTQNAPNGGGLGQHPSILGAGKVDHHIDARRSLEVGVNHGVSGAGERREYL